MLQTGGSNTVNQGRVQEWLFHNANVSTFCPVDHGRARIAGDENRRRRYLPFSQFCDQIEPLDAGHILVDDEASAFEWIKRIQQVAGAPIGANREASTLRENLSDLRTPQSSSTTITTGHGFGCLDGFCMGFRSDQTFCSA